MYPKTSSSLAAGALILGALVAGSPAAHGQELSFFSSNIYTTPKPASFNRSPELEAIVHVPSSLDPSERSDFVLYCFLGVGTDGGLTRIEGVRAQYRSELFVLDRRTGGLEVTDLGGGKGTTSEFGGVTFVTVISTAIFADGFESGDVSAWVKTVARVKKKKGDYVELGCGGILD